MGCRGCALIVAVVLLVVAVVAGGAYYLMTRPSEIVAGLPTVTASKEAAVTLDNKLEKFLEEVKSRPADAEALPVTLEITEEEATSKVAETIQSQQLPIEVANPQVHFQNDRIQASGDVNVSGVNVNVAIQVQIEVEDGKPDVVIEKIEVGRVGVPESVRKQIMDAIAVGIDPTKLQNLPIKLDSVAMVDGKLVINGVPQ